MILEKIKEKLNRLLEASVDVNQLFDSLVSPVAAASAARKYEGKEKTREGQLEILNDAKNGDVDAVNYLYLRYLKIAKKVFWKYFIGPDKSYGMQKVYNGDITEFISAAYFLLGNTESTNPHNSFDPSVYSENTNILNNFAYYYFRYLQSAAFKILRKEGIAGLSGSGANNLRNFKNEGGDEIIRDNNISVESVDEYHSNDKDIATEDFSDREINNMTASKIYNDFIEWLRANKSERYVEIFKNMAAGESYVDTAKKLGIKPYQMVRNIWVKMQDWIKEMNPELTSSYNKKSDEEDKELPTRHTSDGKKLLRPRNY